MVLIDHWSGKKEYGRKNFGSCRIYDIRDRTKWMPINEINRIEKCQTSIKNERGDVETGALKTLANVCKNTVEKIRQERKCGILFNYLKF